MSKLTNKHRDAGLRWVGRRVRNKNGRIESLCIDLNQIYRYFDPILLPLAVRILPVNVLYRPNNNPVAFLTYETV